MRSQAIIVDSFFYLTLASVKNHFLGQTGRAWVGEQEGSVEVVQWEYAERAETEDSVEGSN